MDELSYLQAFLPILAMFVNKACGNYNQKMQLDKHLRFSQDNNHQWVFSYFAKLNTSIQCWKMDGKDIANMSKLVKEFIHCSFMWGSSNSYA